MREATDIRKATDTAIETAIIVHHRVYDVSLAEYTGQIKLVSPVTGEVVKELRPRRFNRCHEMYAAYKLLNNAVRFIADCGYSVILLDTNVKRFASEIDYVCSHIDKQEIGRALQKQLLEKCLINGIEEIKIIN